MEPNSEKKINSKYFRDAAWQQLSGNWSSAVILTLVYFIIVIAVSSVGEYLRISSLIMIAIYPMAYSYSISFLENKRSGSNLKIENLFSEYKSKNFVRIILTVLLLLIYTLLWTLLFIIPGIIKSCAYSQTYYVLRDNPELQYNAAIERSMAMMEGHKMQYFLLQLSFIGWCLLTILTFGVLSFWVVPYMSCTMAHYYEYVKEEYEKNNAQ